MATNQSSPFSSSPSKTHYLEEEEEEEEEYIDMEVSSSSPPQSIEFEFQMSSLCSNDRDSIASPADELFYNGKLLPLHFPPMANKLLQTTTTNKKIDSEKNQNGFSFVSNTINVKTEINDLTVNDNKNTGSKDHNISPADYCRNIGKLNLDEFFFISNTANVKTEINDFMVNDNKIMGFEKRNISTTNSCRASSKLNPDEFSFISNTVNTEIETNDQILKDNKNTGFEECNISPAESCRASNELNPDEFSFISNTANMRIETNDLILNPDGYFLEWCGEARFLPDHQNRRKCQSWIKKIKKIKNSQLGQKIKASKAYLKSLFDKSGCSDKSCSKDSDFGQLGYENEKILISDTLMKGIDREIQRRSISGAINKWHCAPKCSSSSTTSSWSSSSNGYYDLNLLKRSISASLEIESSIEGAIAHCKQSTSCLLRTVT